MPEMPRPGEHHGDAGSSAALITSSSRIEPPGWITAVAPASIATSRPSANGKNASDATTEPLVSGSAKPSFLRCVLRLARGDARGIDPAHLAGADADGGAVLGIDDGVGLHVLGHPEGEAQVAHFGIGRRALGHDLDLHVVDRRHCRAIAPAVRRRPISRSGPPRADRAARRRAAGADSSSRRRWRSLPRSHPAR